MGQVALPEKKNDPAGVHGEHQQGGACENRRIEVEALLSSSSVGRNRSSRLPRLSVMGEPATTGARSGSLCGCTSLRLTLNV
jgi:hypothetical protein